MYGRYLTRLLPLHIMLLTWLSPHIWLYGILLVFRCDFCLFAFEEGPVVSFRITGNWGLLLLRR